MYNNEKINKKIYKSRNDVKLDGVCAGIAEYFGFNVTLVRIFWILATIFIPIFPGIILYAIFVIFVSREPLEDIHNS